MQEAQAGIPLAEAQVAEANANFQKAQTDYDRYNSLFQEGAIAKQELDTAKAAYDVAQAQKNSALQIVQQAKSRLAQTQEGIVSAQARLAASGGELEQAAASGQQTTVNRSEYEAAQSAILKVSRAMNHELRQECLRKAMPNINVIANQRPKSTLPSDYVPLRIWIGVAASMLGAFMAVLDIQITNSSLQDIQAALGATLEEGSWISTAYLVAEIVVIPLTGWLSQVFSIRRYILVNAALFIFFSICCASAWSQLVKAMGQPLIMVPLSAVATAGLAKSQAGSASGLFNMMRNLGGSFGIAALATLLTQREKFHSNRLGDAISLYNPETQQRVDTLTQLFVSKGADFNTEQSQAFQAIASTVSRESYVMAFNDCFYFVGFALLLSGVAVLFFKKVKVSDASGGGH